MKIFVPVIVYAPSAAGIAFVLMMPRSVPACASVRHIVPPQVPSISLGRKRSLSSSDPWLSRALTAPCVSPGYMLNDRFEEQSISSITNRTDSGSPWPPYVASADTPVHPPAAYCVYASLKPRGVRTSPFSYFTPSVSPLWLIGKSTSSQILAPSTSTASIRSGVASSNPGSAANCATSCTSCSKKRISSSGAL